MVSIHRPTGYGPVTLPLRHSAYYTLFIMCDCKRNCPFKPTQQVPPQKFWQSGGSCSAEG